MQIYKEDDVLQQRRGQTHMLLDVFLLLLLQQQTQHQLQLLKLVETLIEEETRTFDLDFKTSSCSCISGISDKSMF